ncbi:MAG: endonuclease/exonuclease/phosphatase family protein, partial [Verrucomicrobia bacterium]|nr:endonuclease/exonuclease/phosphatase family protein [Verrucomicrobiota bacterium]
PVPDDNKPRRRAPKTPFDTPSARSGETRSFTRRDVEDDDRQHRPAREPEPKPPEEKKSEPLEIRAESDSREHSVVRHSDAEQREAAPPRRRRREEEDYSFLDTPPGELREDERQPGESETHFRRRRAPSPEEYGHEIVKPLKRLWRWFCTLVTAATVLYVFVFSLALYAVEFEAEDNIYTAALLYLPPYGWLIPSAVLGFLCAATRPMLCILHAVCAAFLLWFWMGYRMNDPKPARGPALTVVSNNVGQNHGKSIEPFVQAEEADLIVLQDAMSRGPEYARKFPSHYIVGQDEFLLISKFPIRSQGRVPVLNGGKEPVAAWFEVDWKGRTVVVYSVHLPTPRRQLEALKGLGLLATLFGSSGGHGSKVKLDSGAFWANQKQLAEGIVAQLQAERRPFIVCGDFNAPDHGVVYRTFSARLTDSFHKAGHGYGFSFPGDSWFSAWLRLDQIWAGTGFDPVYAATETERPSQHRAVVARLEWNTTK